MKTHGWSRTKEWWAWFGMRQRCRDRGYKYYPRYGGRGITVCERWNIFENFLADMGSAPRYHSLDRIDVNGNYEPSNCRWATWREQENNRTDNRVVTYNGERMTLTQALRAAGNKLSFPGVVHRLNMGWTLERALETPARRADNLKPRNDQIRSWRKRGLTYQQLASQFGISASRAFTIVTENR